ncbi:MAG: serine/threonine protein kinase [Actinomycetia bacterium]|nr:serine/threonine protein kinase [Actinomycetes bacterium]
MEAEDINVDLEGATELGRSDSATVWAVELDDGTRAAAKVFDARTGADDSDRFRREADALSRLPHHPSILRLYAAGLDSERRPVVITERCSAGSLAEWLTDNGPMDWIDATGLAIDLAGALETAHRYGVLHRDVKPSNILCGDDMLWKLADFDVARVMDSPRTTTGQGFASIAHAPPEAFDGDPASPTRDVYSLASTLFQTLTGEPPFGDPQESSMMAVLSRLANEPVADLRPLEIPDPICEVIEKALSKDPLLRHESAETFAAALNEARARCGAAEVVPVILFPGTNSTMWINTAPPRPPTSVNTSDRRGRRVAALVAAAAVVFGVATAAGALVLPRLGISSSRGNEEAIDSLAAGSIADEPVEAAQIPIEPAVPDGNNTEETVGADNGDEANVADDGDAGNDNSGDTGNDNSGGPGPGNDGDNDDDGGPGPGNDGPGNGNDGPGQGGDAGQGGDGGPGPGNDGPGQGGDGDNGGDGNDGGRPGGGNGPGPRRPGGNRGAGN